jgi:hypothetical protein
MKDCSLNGCGMRRGSRARCHERVSERGSECGRSAAEPGAARKQLTKEKKPTAPKKLIDRKGLTDLW